MHFNKYSETPIKRPPINPLTTKGSPFNEVKSSGIRQS